jgi:uncharacterized protein YbbC (DUF1343 family)
MRVRTGLERVLAEHRGLLAGPRVGLLVNPTSVTPSLEHSILALTAAPDVRVTTLFGPEHGIWGTEQDMAGVTSGTDPLTKLPVHSLYGHARESLRPRPEMLADIDVLVYDVQDIGSRYYTFVYTLMLAMEACAAAGVRVVVLDRPNPIGGLLVEGNVVDPAFASFVGMHPLANRHGMTAGELAMLFRAERGIDVELDVVPMEGWTRSMAYGETGLPFIAPSPNMPRVETALVYPGMCLVEGTNLSEGRGTTLPFEVIGAPFVEPMRLAKALRAEGLPGCDFRPLWFRPTFQKHAGTLCGGVQVHVTDESRFAPLRTGLAIVVAARRLWPEVFDWRREPYEFVSDRLAIDLLLGTDALRHMIERGATVPELVEACASGQAAFEERRQPFLLYGELEARATTAQVGAQA